MRTQEVRVVRSMARRLLRPLRRFNRWWIDQLDPDWPRAEPVRESVRPAARPATSPHAKPEAAAPAPAPRVASGPVNVHAESTPNPDAVKFVCSVSVVSEPVTWRAGDRTSDPVGVALMAIPGIRSAFAVGDFVTVTREPQADWDLLAQAVEQALISALGG